jgi:hypothetical protein
MLRYGLKAALLRIEIFPAIEKGAGRRILDLASLIQLCISRQLALLPLYRRYFRTGLPGPKTNRLFEAANMLVESSRAGPGTLYLIRWTTVLEQLSISNPFSLDEIVILYDVPILLLLDDLISQLYCVHRISATPNHIHRVLDLLEIAGATNIPQIEPYAKFCCFESTLESDPSGVYIGMDAASKMYYRRAIEYHSMMSGEEARQVAMRSLAMATSDSSHIGEYLLGPRQSRLIQALRGSYSPFGASLPERTFLFWSVVSMLLSLVTLIAFLLSHTANYMLELATVGMIPLISDLGDRLYEIYLQLVFPPRPLLKMMAMGPRPAIIIAIPVVLSDLETNSALISMLQSIRDASDEVHAVVLLTDLRDSVEPGTTAWERAVLEDLVSRINHLNDSMANVQLPPKYIILHRDRDFVESEAVWMGRERKRGKLKALNDLLTGKGNHFSLSSATASHLIGIEYVMTLDERSFLPGNSMRSLLGAIMHPLNSMRPEAGCPDASYTIFHPLVLADDRLLRGRRLLCSLLNNRLSMERRRFGKRNPHFDAIGRTSFYGKGVYHVDSFSRRVASDVGCDPVLSHDVIEAGVARAAFDSGAHIIEDPPMGLRQLYLRRHRWTRGDCQNMVLLLKRALRQPLHLPSPYAVYLILSCTRKDAVPFTWLVIGLLCFGGGMCREYAMAAASASLVPDVFVLIVGTWRLLRVGRFDELRSLFRNILRAAYREWAQLAVAPHLAIISTDAFSKGVLRSCRGKLLLEWKTAAAVEGEILQRHKMDYAIGLLGLLQSSLLIIALAKRNVIALCVSITWLAATVEYFDEIRRDRRASLSSGSVKGRAN